PLRFAFDALLRCRAVTSSPWARALPFVPALVVIAAAALTPMSELHSNQGDVGLYLEKARALVSGLVPYRDFPFEYPPLALVPMVVPYLFWPFGTVNLEAYRWLFAGWEAVLMLGLGTVLVRIVRLVDAVDGDEVRSMALRLIVLTAGAALAITWRYDLYPALLVMVALRAALEGRAGAAGVAIGLGVLAKLYPLAVVPALAIPWLVPLDRPRLVRYGLSVALTIGLLMAPFVLLAGGDAFAFLSYQGQRGLQIESIGGGLAVLIGLLTGHRPDLSFGFSAVQVAGPFAEAWLRLLPLATVAGFAALGWLGWRRLRAGPVPPAAVIAFAGAAVLMLVATSKVFSIQYVVWIVPFAAFMSGRRFWLAAALVALTMPIHPLLYGDLVKQAPLPILILNARNALFLALTAWTIWDLARSDASEGALADRPDRGAA
ncbi:MAG: hypothetical protein M3O77_02995, partial [Chloroflexota bacterium]|nr:hypothetical protein [Chloroflexota bacterium]